jgi:hypothetical protein
MARGRKPLLAELHAHTTWSDGVLTPGELVDSYGRAGFDVLAIRYHWVAERALPFVATGDFHSPEHLFTWKTLLTCERTERAVVDRLRSSAPCALMRITASRVAA